MMVKKYGSKVVLEGRDAVVEAKRGFEGIERSH